jgi:ribonuclease HI
MSVYWKLFVDGASRNNPGEAAAGIYIVKDNTFFLRRGYFLGIKTNNQAEYLALLLGLLLISEYIASDDIVHIVSDSQLLVYQLRGIYRVKKGHLLPLYQACKERIAAMNAIITHVLREENSHADEMANFGIVNKNFPPDIYIDQLKKHGITI